jgi:preprotein translocase subunit SecE
MNDKINKIISDIKIYFKGVKSEWGKITWPERKQVFAETLFVIVIVFVFTVMVYLMDLIFKGILGFIPR